MALHTLLHQISRAAYTLGHSPRDSLEHLVMGDDFPDEQYVSTSLPPFNSRLPKISARGQLPIGYRHSRVYLYERASGGVCRTIFER